MKKYNRNIPPLINTKSDEYYVNDLVVGGNMTFPNDKEIRYLIRDYRLTRDQNILTRLTNIFGKFILSVVKNYQENGLDLSDLISEGMSGLFVAINKFDLNGDTKFITYAYTIIVRYALEAIDHNKYMIKLPKNIRAKLNKNSIAKAKNNNLDYNSNLDIINKSRASDIQTTEALDSAIIIENNFNKESLDIDISRILNLVLTPLEKKIIEYKFGINVEFNTNSLHQIASILNLSNKKVKSLYLNALNKLQDIKVKNILNKYLNG